MGMTGEDKWWFKDRPRRQCRIRNPVAGEFSTAWQMLGDHDATRRRVAVWRVPRDNPYRKLVPDGIIRVPFLARSDESFADDDTVTMRVLDELMRDAAAAKATNGFAITREETADFKGWVV
jgi:hypothetical protein